MNVGKTPTGPLRRIVAANTSEYDVTRVSYGTDSLGDDTESESTVTDVPLWLFDPEEATVQELTGERLTGSLSGLCEPSVDVQVDDRVSHGGNTYTVTSIVGIPNDSNPIVNKLSLVRGDG